MFNNATHLARYHGESEGIGSRSSTWPSGVLFGVEGRYLLERTDYRSVFWEVLRDHMGADPSGVDSIFPGYQSLGLAQGELGLVRP